MKKTVALMLASCMTLAACDVDQTKEGEMPDVDVNASGGQVPEFNVEGPDVNVGTENKTVEVPTVDVDVPEENAQ
jgi:predicted small secreted protein